MPPNNDLRNDVVDDATSTTEFNDCDNISNMLTFDDVVTIVVTILPGWTC